MKLEFLTAVILVSQAPHRLATFYRTLGIELEESYHTGPNSVHFECDLGDVHFAVQQGPPGLHTRAVRIGFAVRNVDEFVRQISERTNLQFSMTTDQGFARLVTTNDPDGNTVVLTELSPGWLAHLARRSPHQRDVVVWRNTDSYDEY